MDIEAAKKLRDEGKSLREIAKTLGVSKTTVATKLKGWLNPTWEVVSGGDGGTVDVYGAVEEPSFQVLVSLYEDTVYACAKWISDQISSTPLRVYVKTLPGQRKPKCPTAPIIKSPALDYLANHDVREVLDHTFLDIIKKPNPDMNTGDMLRIIDIDLSLTGNGYLYKQREFHRDGQESDYNEGLPVALYPLPAQDLQLHRDNKDRIIGWIDTRPSTPKFIPTDDVVWIKLVDPKNPYGLGYGPLRGVYERVLLAKQELAYLSALYRNQARPDSLISIKDITGDEAKKVQKELNQRFSKAGMGGPWVAPGDIKATPLNWSPKDVLGVELYKWTKLQILNAFGLNPAIFDQESSNRAVADTARYMAILNGVLPRQRLIEDKINEDLAPEFDERLLVKFDDVLPEERQEDLDEQVKLLAAGVLDVDEVRKMRGLPPRLQPVAIPQEENEE